MSSGEKEEPCPENIYIYTIDIHKHCNVYVQSSQFAHA